MNPVIAFIAVCLLCAVLLWGLAQWPGLDAVFVKFIRVILIIVVSIMGLNLLLLLIFGHPLPFYLDVQPGQPR